MDAAVKMTGMDVGPCKTTHMPVAGAVHWKPDLFTEVAQNYTVPHRPGFIDTRVAQHLARSYGDRARHVTRVRLVDVCFFSINWVSGVNAVQRMVLPFGRSRCCYLQR